MSNIEMDTDHRHARHPLLVDYLQQYPKCEEEAAEKTFQVYLDLTEVKGWWSTELLYSNQYERPYIVGQDKRFIQRQAVLPVGAEESFSPQRIRQFFTGLVVDEEPIKSLILAVTEADTSVVYYKLTSGLLPPVSPETAAIIQKEKSVRITKRKQYVAQCVRKAMLSYKS